MKMRINLIICDETLSERFFFIRIMYGILCVPAPHASIAEGSELSVVSGSVVSLTCIIHDCSHPPSHVFWYHGQRVINYDKQSRINITSLLHTSPEPGALETSRKVSRLIIADVGKQHSGSYTCAPVHATPATAHVHVLHGKFFFFFYILFCSIFGKGNEMLSLNGVNF